MPFKGFCANFLDFMRFSTLFGYILVTSTQKSSEPKLAAFLFEKIGPAQAPIP